MIVRGGGSVVSLIPDESDAVPCAKAIAEKQSAIAIATIVNWSLMIDRMRIPP